MSVNAGMWGRVYVTGYGNIAEISVWNYDGTTAEIALPHFESPVDAYGRIWPEYIPGLSSATGTCEGYYNSIAPLTVTNPTGGSVMPAGSDVIFSNGFYATVKLFTDKRGNWGYACTAFFTSFRVETQVENQPVKFTANFRVTGVMPLGAVV